MSYDLTATKLSIERLAVLDALSTICFRLPGDFAECGVWLGGSAKVLMKGRPLHLFDTFTGMPKNDDPCGLNGGQFSDTSANQVREYLDGEPTLHIGLIPDTFKGLESITYSFVHIDVDLYQTTQDCLDYFLPRLTSGAIMVFDDYGFPDYEFSEKKAVDERVKVTALPTGQAIYIQGER